MLSVSTVFPPNPKSAALVTAFLIGSLFFVPVNDLVLWRKQQEQPVGFHAIPAQ
jgi:hypothetical protein